MFYLNDAQVWTEMDGSGQLLDRSEGLFELREDECTYEAGVLSIVFKQVPPKRMRLGGRPSSLATTQVYESCQGIGSSNDTGV